LMMFVMRLNGLSVELELQGKRVEGWLTCFLSEQANMTTQLRRPKLLACHSGPALGCTKANIRVPALAIPIHK
jgi:hypothetical protein